MGLGVQHAVAAALVDLAERVARVTAAAAEIARLAETGETVQERAGGIAAGLVDEWAGEVARVVQEGRPDWHPLTIAWWTDAWHSPMADQWLQVDRHALTRLAVLVEMFAREPAKDLLGEIRLQEQRFGLTWADRYRLQYNPDKVRPTKAEAPPAATPPADPGEDPRTRLKAVK